MEQGLAHQMVYGDGQGQSTKHHYAKNKPKHSSVKCGKKKNSSRK